MSLRIACIVCDEPLDDHGPYQTSSCLTQLRRACHPEGTDWGDDAHGVKQRMKLVGRKLPAPSTGGA